jgi:hypothetical protein
MPVDPWGIELDPIPDQMFYELPYRQSYDEPSWRDLISQGIDAATRAYQIGEAGYPPGSTIVYSPTTQYPGQTTPMPGSTQQPPVTTQQPPPDGGGVKLSNMTLMLLVGGALLFFAGKRGR